MNKCMVCGDKLPESAEDRICSGFCKTIKEKQSRHSVLNGENKSIDSLRLRLYAIEDRLIKLEKSLVLNSDIYLPRIGSNAGHKPPCECRHLRSTHTSTSRTGNKITYYGCRACSCKKFQEGLT